MPVATCWGGGYCWGIYQEQQPQFAAVGGHCERHNPPRNWVHHDEKGKIRFKSIVGPRASLVVQWLRLHTPNARGPGLIPDQELDPESCN